MTAEQVVRAAIIKQMEMYSYEEFAFHLLDSVCYRSFCRIGFSDKGFQKSALCKNIGRPSTASLLHTGKIKRLEKGNKQGSTAQ